MQAIPQIMPISNLRTNYNDVLTKLDSGPVILSQRGTPAAVILSALEWNRIAQELQRLRRLELGDRASQEIGLTDEVGDETVDRPVVQILRRPVLLDPALVHDQDPVRNKFDHGKIMRNENIGEVMILFQSVQQVENLGLN